MDDYRPTTSTVAVVAYNFSRIKRIELIDKKAGTRTSVCVAWRAVSRPVAPRR